MSAAEPHSLTPQQPFDNVALVRCPLDTGSIFARADNSPFARLTEEEPPMRTAGIYTDVQQNACHLYTRGDSAMHVSRRFI